MLPVALAITPPGTISSCHGDGSCAVAAMVGNSSGSSRWGDGMVARRLPAVKVRITRPGIYALPAMAASGLCAAMV